MDSIREVLKFNMRRLRGTRSQAEVAELAGIPLRTYQNAEYGRIPQEEGLTAIAKAYCVSESELFRDPDFTHKPTLQEALAVLQDAVSKLESFRSHSKTGDELLDELEKETFGKTRQKKTHSGNDSSA